MIICDYFGHLYTTDDLLGLYNFAVHDLRLKPEWNHYSRYFPHWDLTTDRKRKQAWSLGAHRPTNIENAALIREAESYARSALPVPAPAGIVYESKGLYKQSIKRINWDILMPLLKENDNL